MFILYDVKESMRTSSRRHVLAVLREVIGEKQETLPPIIGCSQSTVVSIESGRLRLSEKLAEKISLATGVSVGWLLDNNTRKPPVDRDGHPYTKETFEAVQAEEECPKNRFVDYMVALVGLGQLYQKAAALLVGAVDSERGSLFIYKANKAMDALLEQAGVQWGDKNNPLAGGSLEPNQTTDLFQKAIAAISKQKGVASEGGAWTVSSSGLITRAKFTSPKSLNKK